ncbi:MAG: ECF transporter S component [Candidatus Bathyarchaeia archaeon]
MIQKISPFNIIVTAIFTALVCVVTIVFSIFIPATKGIFNLGESMVYLAALLFGPVVGAFAGGVGSMLADIYVGVWYYAPATLIIKACEGYVVGRLKDANPRFVTKIYYRFFTILLGVIIGLLLIGVGILYGQTEFSIFPSYSLIIPAEFWLVLGVIAAFSIATVGLIAKPETGWKIFSVIVGGLVMVMGYFIYQMFFIGWLFGIPVVAIAEIPVNIGQMITGAIIALPIARIIQHVFPYIQPETR